MSESKRRPILSKLKLIPVAIASAILFAVLSLLGLLNFSTPGTGDPSNAVTEQPETTVDAQVNSQLVSESTSSAVEDGDPLPLVPLELVDVLIDGDDYWVANGRMEDQLERGKRTLAEITTASAETDGDAAGIKVRVTRTFSATAQAERTLVSALTDAGISDDEIDQRRTLVERPSSLGP